MPGTKEHRIKIDFYKRKEERKKAKLEDSVKMSDFWKVRKDKTEAINTMVVRLGVGECSRESFGAISLPMLVSVPASQDTEHKTKLYKS